MLPIVIEPLIFWYKTIDIRTTNLERFGQCPMNFKKAVVDWKKEAFEFWKVAHNAIQAYVFNPDIREDILEFVCSYREDYCDMIRAYMNLVDQNILAHKYKAILNEVQGMIEIHYGNYKILMEGTADLVFKRDWVKWYIIWDIKTSRVEWKEWTLDGKLQRFIYTYMVGQKVGFDNILWFEYMIFTKHKHPRYQCLGTYNLTQDFLESTIKSKIIAYIYALDHDKWPAIQNKYCWFCPLKKEKKCPIFGGADFNL